MTKMLQSTVWAAMALLVSCVEPTGRQDDDRARADAETGSGTASSSLEVFSDESGSSGLDFVHFNGMSGELYLVEIMGGGAALFDFDNDGDLDVYLAQGHMLGPGKTLEDATMQPQGPSPQRDRLFRNDLMVHPDGDRSLRFTDVTKGAGVEVSGYGMGVTAGDFDNDGWVDLYVTNFGDNTMLRNNGDGTFRDVTAMAGTNDRRLSIPAAFFDYDRDGWLDLFVGNYVDFRIASHKECVSASGMKDYCGPLAYDPEPDRLLRNRRDGTFEDVTAKAGLRAEFGNALGVIPTDVNGDGWIDIYVANDSVPNQLWINQQDGTFRNDALRSGCAVNAEGQPEASMGIDAGDFDGDGDEDLFMTHSRRETNTIYLNDGNGWFVDSTVQSGLGMESWKFTGFGTAWFDYDNDGWLDLAVVNGAVTRVEELYLAGDPYPLHQTNQLFRNMGNGRFQEITQHAGSAFDLSEVSRGAAFGDIDNDGDTDILVVNNSGPARLLINNVGHERHWMGLRLVDAEGRRDMLGAWVGILRRGRPGLWRRVRTAGSYASASDPRVLVGLADTTDVEKVRVQWPSGTVETWEGLPVNQYSTLREGSGKEEVDSP